MAEPSAIWSERRVVTDKSISITQNIILSYAREALQTLIRRIDEVHRITELPEGDNAVIGSEVPALLSDIVFHQGLASLLLFKKSIRGENESEEAYNSRVERAAYVAQRCQALATPALKSRKSRNSLAHLDEYLVKELSAPDTGWFVDVALNRRDEFKTTEKSLKIAFCRSYVISEDKLLNFGNEVVLSELKKEAEQVLAAVWLDTDVSYYSGPLYDAVISSKPYRLRLIKWWQSFPVPYFLAWAKNRVVKQARQLLQFFRR